MALVATNLVTLVALAITVAVALSSRQGLDRSRRVNQEAIELLLDVLQYLEPSDEPDQ